MNTSGFDRFKHHWPGYRQVLRSDGVQAMLQAKATAVRHAAEGRLPAGNKGTHIRIIGDTNVGRNRAGGTVIGVPMHLERRYRILGQAIDAGRSA